MNNLDKLVDTTDHSHGPNGCWVARAALSSRVDAQQAKIRELEKDLGDEAEKAGIAQEALIMLGCPYELRSKEFEMWVSHTAYKLGILKRG